MTAFYALIQKDETNTLPAAASFISATLIHTVLVVAALMIFSQELKDLFGNDILGIIYANVAVNGLIESLLAVAIGTPVYMVIKKLRTKEV